MKTLKDSIEFAICLCVGPAADAPLLIRNQVRDFMAEKFHEATLKTKTEAELKLLQELWFNLTGEKL